MGLCSTLASNQETTMETMGQNRRFSWCTTVTDDSEPSESLDRRQGHPNFLPRDRGGGLAQQTKVSIF